MLDNSSKSIKKKEIDKVDFIKMKTFFLPKKDELKANMGEGYLY